MRFCNSLSGNSKKCFYLELGRYGKVPVVGRSFEVFAEAVVELLGRLTVDPAAGRAADDGALLMEVTVVVLDLFVLFPRTGAL